MPSSFGKRAILEASNASDGLPPIKVEDFKEINKESFAVILSSTHTTRPYTQEQYHEALSSMTESKLGIVSGSLFKIPGFRNPVFRCIAASNREVLPYNDKEMQARGMRTTVANVLEDSNGHIWRVVSNGDSKQIVQVTEDNHTELLAKRRARAMMTANMDNDNLDIPFDDTDYLYFFNPKIEAMDFGFAVKSGRDIFAMSRTLKDTVRITAHQVIEAASTDGYGLNLSAKRKEITAARSTGGMAEYIAYLRSLYGKNNEYVKAWEKAIKNSPNVVS